MVSVHAEEGEGRPGPVFSVPTEGGREGRPGPVVSVHTEGRDSLGLWSVFIQREGMPWACGQCSYRGRDGRPGPVVSVHTEGGTCPGLMYSVDLLSHVDLLSRSDI